MNAKTKYLIYGLVDPQTDEVRYIGKSMSGMRRPSEHCMPHEVRGDLNYHKTRWIRRLLSSGIRPTIVIFDALEDPAGLSELEQYRIAYGRAAGWPLTNLTAGGGGNVGLCRTAESRARMSASMRGKNRGPLSMEHRAKLSAANRERFARMTPEERLELTAAMRAKAPRQHSEMARAKMSAAQKKRQAAHPVISPDTRRRLATFTGKKHSPETLAKMRETQRLRWVNRPPRLSKRDELTGQWKRGEYGLLDGNPEGASQR